MSVSQMHLPTNTVLPKFTIFYLSYSLGQNRRLFQVFEQLPFATSETERNKFELVNCMYVCMYVCISLFRVD